MSASLTHDNFLETQARTAMEAADRTEWQSIALPGEAGRRVYIEVVSRGGREEVGILDAIPFEHVMELITSIASGIGDTLEKAKPKKAAVELGVEFGVEAGHLVALIARGTGKANLKIRLEWERSAPHSASGKGPGGG
jgi:Trypsin-co-occurring domain 1